jgi:hypothetical protein
VTAKLSQKLYERLGEDIAIELVDWFNAVDATYQDDLRELNKQNFRRFAARIDRRFAEADVKAAQRFAAFDRRIAEADATAGQRFAAFDRRIADIERRFAEFRAEVEVSVAQLRAELRTGLSETRADLLKWMFGFWIATLVPLAGLMVGLATMLR